MNYLIECLLRPYFQKIIRKSRMQAKKTSFTPLEVKINCSLIHRPITPNQLCQPYYKRLVNERLSHQKSNFSSFDASFQSSKHSPLKIEPLPEYINDYLYDPIRISNKVLSTFSNPRRSFVESNKKISKKSMEHEAKFYVPRERAKSAPRSRNRADQPNSLDISLNYFKSYANINIGVVPVEPHQIKFIKNSIDKRLSKDLENRRRSQKFIKVQDNQDKTTKNEVEPPMISPSLTFGEKLYRLNQLSVINLLN